MAHQIDFHITLWSDKGTALAVLEKELQLIAMRPDVSPIGKVWEFTLLLRKFSDIINGFDAHSTDINWDDDVPIEPSARLKELLANSEGFKPKTEGIREFLDDVFSLKGKSDNG